MIKYRAASGWAKIEAVEVERETECFVWIKGRRNSKKTEYYNYFDSFNEAKSALLKNAVRALETAKKRVGFAEEELIKIEELKESNV